MQKSHHIHWAVGLGLDLAGGALYATGIELFARHADFAPGGLSGLALILNHLWHVPVGLTVLVLNIPLILLSFRTVGGRFLLRTLRSMLIYTLALDLVFARLPAYEGNPLLAALYSGFCIGGGLALFYLHGSSSGGTDLLTMTIKIRRPYLSIGFVTLILDICIIALGWPAFGNVDALLYGLICTGVTSAVMDRILNGASMGKLLTIVTAQGCTIATAIGQDYGRGVTVLEAAGGYTGARRQVLLCACGKSEAHRIRGLVYTLDPQAFVMVSQANEIFGLGFTNPNQKTSFL